jgi:hypothetical protein
MFLVVFLQIHPSNELLFFVVVAPLVWFVCMDPSISAMETAPTTPLQSSCLELQLILVEFYIIFIDGHRKFLLQERDYRY